MMLGAKFEIRVAPGKGRGLFATARIADDELIETAAAVPLSSADCELIHRTVLGDYYFAHPESDEQGMFILGGISVANHAIMPNAVVTWRCDPSGGWFAVLHALRPIERGEEITRRYVCAPWFDVRP